jgi:diguanylate cyclase (GGDEF)-like protein
MYILINLNIETGELIDIIGEDSFISRIDKKEMSDRLSMYMYEKNVLGHLKGGILFNILETDYRGVYSIEGDICNIVLINHLITFEDVYGEKKDELTELDGKLAFINELETLLKNEIKFQVYLFNVDNFRNVNDVFGKKTGDDIIKELVNRILFNLVSNFKIYRYEGDTFAIIREGRNETKFVNNLMKLFDDAFIINNSKVYITVSLGYLLIDSYIGVTAESLIDRSYIALNHAKNSGKNTTVLYNDKLKDQSLMELEMETMIRDALKNNQFELYYQPQFSLGNNKIIGAEALIRWNHPERGFITPYIFIPIAEKSGLIVQIGEWVVKEACRQLREWQDKGINTVRIAVNIGSLHFNKSSFVEDILNNLLEYNIHFDMFGLEVTEGSVISDVDAIVLKLDKLRKKGIKVSIDDFGTGYSSLSYLKRLPIDTLKIDQSFILNIPKDLDNIAIVKAIISLAKNMDIKVIAEGVETTEARDLLRKLDCHDMQGYLFSKPINSREFEMLLIA